MEAIEYVANKMDTLPSSVKLWNGRFEDTYPFYLQNIQTKRTQMN